MPDSEKLTAVIFRKDRDGIVFAIFPELEETGRTVTTYDHVGGHSSGPYGPLIDTTRPARPEEYEELRRELESAPYNYRLQVRKRRAAWSRRNRA